MFDRTGLGTSSACFEHCGQLDITDAWFAAHCGGGGGGGGDEI